MNAREDKGDTVELILVKELGKYGDVGHFLILIFWNYFEELIVIGADR